MAGFLAPESDTVTQPTATTAFGDPILGTTVPGGHQARDFGDAFIAGLQASSGGLAKRGKLPDMELGPDSPWYHRLASGVGQLVGDVPAMVAGGVAAQVVTGGKGGPMASAVGAFAAPMALREALIEAYTHNYATTWEGVQEVGFAAAKGGAKGAVLGAVTMGAGRVVAPILAPAGRAAVVAGTTGAEITALTTTGAALEGHMPAWQDFMDNAILLGGVKASAHVARGMYHIFAETGRTPEQIAADAKVDPALAEALKNPPKPGELPQPYGQIALEQRIESALDKDARPEVLRKNMTDEPRALELDKADPVKYEYIADGETARGVLREVTGLYQAEINAQTRGVVPNATTAAEGLKQVSDGSIAPHVIGEAGNAAEIYARAHLLRGATAHAVGEFKKLAGIPEAELSPAAKLSALAALERVAMLKAEVEGVGAEAGRALQIFRAIKRDPSFLGDAEGLLKLAERKGKLQDIAKMVADMKDPAQLAEFSRQYNKATTMEQVIEGWRAAILSGPQTHMANIMGNLTKMFVEIPESVLSASLYALDKAAHGDPLTLSQWKARAFAPYYGIKLGSKEAIFAAAEVWKMKGASVEKADVFREAIPGKAGEVIRLPFRALQVEDVLFRTLAERAEAYKLAVDRAVKEGLHPETAEGRERVTLYTGRPDFGLEAKDAAAAIKRIQDVGAESVFSQRLGPRMEIAQRAMAGSALSFIVPFVRTPANLVSWALQHTPGLNLLSGRWREDFSAGGEARARAVARVAIGTGLAATAYTLASDGSLTGGGMFDKEERRTKTAAGWQPYSIKIGEKYYSYQRIEPVAKVLGLAADLIELDRNTTDKEDKAKIATMLVLMFGNATVSTTYLSGLSNAIQAITDPGRYGENFLEQYASSLVPKAVGQVVTAADPHKREVNGIFDAIQSQLPFLREKLLPKRDVWGEPQKNDRWFAVLPVATSDVSQEKVRTEAARLHLAIADAPRFAMERAPFSAKEKRVDLTEPQRDIFREVSGKNAMEILAPIVNSSDWSQIPDFAKAEVYKKVIEGARKQGMYSALPPDDPSREKLREKLIEKVIKQTRDAETNVPAPERRVK